MKDKVITVVVTIALIILCGVIFWVVEWRLGINITPIFMIIFLGLFMARLIQWFDGKGKGGEVVFWGWWLAFSTTRYLSRMLRGSEHTWAKIGVDLVYLVLAIWAIFYLSHPSYQPQIIQVQSVISAFLRRFYRP